MIKTIAVQLTLENVANELRDIGYDVISLSDLDFSNQYVNAIVYSHQEAPATKLKQSFNSSGVIQRDFETVYIDAGQKEVKQIVEEVIAAVGRPQ